MKKPITWRLLVLVAGTLLGLLAGLGLSAPATAAAPSSVAAASYDRHGADLDLDIKHNGKFVVKGDNFKAKKVYVKVVKVTGHKYKVVAHKHVWTDRYGDFKFSGKKLQCGKSYKAFSYSYKDGWDSSKTLRVKCHAKRGY